MQQVTRAVIMAHRRLACSRVSCLLCAWQCLTQHVGVGMYLDFYQLKRAPFQRTPDPALLFRSASHQGAVDTIAAGIGARQSLVVITGAPGVGKTTLVHAYLARVAPPQLTTIVLWRARLSFRELLALIARRFAVPVVTDDPGAMLTQIQQRLKHESEHG